MQKSSSSPPVPMIDGASGSAGASNAPPSATGLPPNLTPENMQQTLEMLQATLSSMPEEERLKLFEKMTDEERKILLPGGNASLGKDGIKHEEAGIKVTPQAGFTMKTKDDNGNKIFINICTSDVLAPPGMKKKLNDKGETVEGYNVPMSIGPARKCTDKSGVESTVYDMIVNPEVMTEIHEDITGKQRDFICQLALQCVSSKYKLTFDSKYKLPHKLDYIGEVAHQWIKDMTKVPKIEEVSNTSNTSSGTSSSGAGNATSGLGNNNKKTKKGTTSSSSSSGASMVVENLKDLPIVFTWAREPESTASTEAATSSSTTTNLEEVDTSEIRPSHLIPTHTYIECHQLIPSTITAYILTVDPIAAVFLKAGGGSENAIDIDQNVHISASPFKIQLKINGYKPATYYLPAAVHPALITSTLSRSSEGYTNKLLKLTLTLPIDHRYDVTVPDSVYLHHHSNAVNSFNNNSNNNNKNPKYPRFYQSWDALLNGDPGSRPWLVAHALNADSSGRDYNPYIADILTNENEEDNNESKENNKNKNKHHASPGAPLPFSAVNTLFDKVNDHFVVYSTTTGSNKSKSGKTSVELLEEADAEILPEDRFHSKDAGSQYIISQREQSVQEKREKFEKEKAERQKDDPNVEYVDTDDYKPGGKYGGPKSAHPGDATMYRAATTIASNVRPGDNDAAANTAARSGADASAAAPGEPGGLASLTSTLWSELL